MKTMYKGLVNSPETTITNDIGTNDTIIYVLDPTRVPSDLPNLMVLGTGTNAETIKVTAIEGNALTVERGFQGIAKDWLTGTIIARNFTEYDYAALVDNVNELELTKETPDGAQSKADTAEGNAKTYASDLIGVLSNLKTTVKDKIVSAINELFDNLASHLAEKATDSVRPHGMGTIASRDYEEGSWTPILRGLTVAGVNTYSVQRGKYRKLGNTVVAQFELTLSAKDANMSGGVEIGGLPFSMGSNGHGAAIATYSGLTFPGTGRTQLVGYGDSARILLQASGNGVASANLQATDIASNTSIRGTISYTIN